MNPGSFLAAFSTLAMHALLGVALIVALWSCGQATVGPARQSPKGEPPASHARPAVIVECDLVSRPAVRVQVRDSVTGADITRWSTAVARDGEFADSATQTLRIPSELGFGPMYLSLAYDRAGSYTVVVRRPGYRSWSRAGIRASLDRHGCTVDPVYVSAFLAPVPGLTKRAVPLILGPVLATDSGGRGPRFLVQEGQWVDQQPWLTSSRIWVELHPLTRIRDAAGRHMAAIAVRPRDFLHAWTTAALPRTDSGRVVVDSIVVTPPS